MGYEVTRAKNLPEMLNLLENNVYDAYLMYVNLHSIDPKDVSPASEVLDKIKPRLNEGKSVYLGFTSNLIALARAERLLEEKGLNPDYAIVEETAFIHENLEAYLKKP